MRILVDVNKETKLAKKAFGNISGKLTGFTFRTLKLVAGGNRFKLFKGEFVSIFYTF